MTRNEAAFLKTLSVSEGTDNGKQPTRDRGYDVIVGGNLLFTNYKDHPRIVVKLNDKLSSSAAGRYQILAKYYDSYKESLNLPDFSPASQDSIALQMIKEQKAQTDLNIGNFEIAIAKCSNIWASLPGAGYGQHEQKIEYLRNVYLAAGGKIGSA